MSPLKQKLNDLLERKGDFIHVSLLDEDYSVYLLARSTLPVRLEEKVRSQLRQVQKL